MPKVSQKRKKLIAAQEKNKNQQLQRSRVGQSGPTPMCLWDRKLRAAYRKEFRFWKQDDDECLWHKKDTERLKSLSRWYAYINFNRNLSKELYPEHKGYY